MGKQILFHMLEEDQADFFAHLRSLYPCNITAWTSMTPEMLLISSPQGDEAALALWPIHSDVKIEREKTVRDDGTVVFEFNRRVPVLEFTPSRSVEWSEMPALLQGRIYLFASEDRAEVGDILRTATRWIKKNYEPCPVASFGGYVAPAAMRWFIEGGVLLPMFNPPSTEGWKMLVAKQHRRTPRRSA